MWKSLKLCSHCVAVAHSVGCVSGFIEWYAANAKKANITKLTTQSVPRSVGKKSSHARYSRSKGKTPVTACVAPVFTDQPPSSSIYNESISSSIYNQETEAIPRPPVPKPTSHYSSFDQPPDKSTSSYHPPWYADPYPYWNPYSYGPPPFGSPSFSPSFSCFSPSPMPLGHGAKSPSSAARSYPISYGTSSHPCPPTSFTLSHGASGPHPPTSLSPLTVPPYGSPLRYQFWVCKLNNRITTCYGCRGKFTRAADGSVPVVYVLCI